MMLEIKIEQIKTFNDLDKIKSLISDYGLKPYYFLTQLKPLTINKLFKKQLSKIISDKNNFCLAVKEGSEYIGFIVLERENWDSCFFGFDCYKIENIFVNKHGQEAINLKRKLFKQVFSICKKRKIGHLSIKTDTRDNSTIFVVESFGFYLVATMLRFIYFASQKRQHFRQIGKIRPYRKNDLKILRDIAKDSMFFDHFHSDFHFSKEASDNVYVSLVENCCKGILADKVFVVEKAKKVVGYVACKIYHDLNKILPLRIGYIRHLAVSKSDGFGCGPGLQEVALNWFKNKVDIVESATTIQNLPIIKISVKSNMNIASSYLRFSKWFNI